jgi:tRNA (cytidine32/uridine32-2'-O)-methyltransferase
MSLDLLSRIRIVLIATTHPGNIGSSARAMKTMGLSRLVLVAPACFPAPEATALAAGADDVLGAAQVVPDLDTALAGCVHVFGCTPRPRTVPMPELDPRAAAPLALAQALGGEVAIVFGTESSGLSNAQVQRCHVAVNIPANPAYDSLNLSQAVQVLCYELRCAATTVAPAAGSGRTGDPLATSDELEGLFGHLDQALFEIDFLKGRGSANLMRRLRRLLLRAAPSRREVLIVRGILADAQRCARLAGVAEAARKRGRHAPGHRSREVEPSLDDGHVESPGDMRQAPLRGE